MRRIAYSSLAATLVFLAGVAVAHGDWPAKHGGVMSVGGEITMEMVQDEGRTLIYVEDHGEPVAIGGAKATLEVLRADGSREVLPLAVHEANSFRASTVDFALGSKVIVTIHFDSGILMTGRFFKRFE